MSKPIIDLMDDKIKQLERYNEVTTQIISEDIDSVGELLDERQQIIAAMDGISLDIKQFVNDQSIERRDKINALLNFEDIGELNGELQLLQEKIKRVQALRSEIKSNDTIAYNRIKKERDDLKAKLENAAKSKQVVDYFSQTSVDVTKGARLNLKN